MEKKAKKFNGNLHKASKEKNDEFYTQLSDIEKEMKNYKEHLKGKTIFCNCDDPEWSNFWKYFSLNFKHLGLKKLISTHYSKEGSSFKLEMELGKNDNPSTKKTNLKGNGDFRSEEAVEILKEADLVITNPPFSLFREYIQQLIEHEKQFIIIGNTNAITYKEVFKLIKENKVWLGVSPRSMSFRMPDGAIKQVNACWFTNLPHKKRNEKIDLFKKYKGNEKDYPTYDNYKAIEVSKVVNIPEDYKGVMGVPITFLEKYNPQQFKILGMSASAGYDKEVVGIPFLGEKDARPLIGGKNTYARILIKTIKEIKK